MVKYLIATLFIGFSFGAQSQSSIAKGQAIDAITREPIVGLQVCARSGACALTDEMGYFEVAANGDTDSLEFRGLGYRMTEAPRFSSQVVYGIVQSPSELSGVTVSAYRNGATSANLPASVAIARPRMLKMNDQSSLQQVLNTVPGVWMDSRGYGGSQRINIRGNFLRNPTAVRNVKMYMNGIPISSPDGTAPLEIVDAFDLRNVEIIKGPAGSAYGSGTGGVILFSQKRPGKYARQLNHAQLYGAFGMKRYSTEFMIDRSNYYIRASHVYQENKGFRDQEWNRKQQFTLSSGIRVSDKLNYFLMTTYYDGQLALPGALDSAKVAANPRQAVPYSVTNNTNLYRNRSWSGVSQTWKPISWFSNTTSLYFTTTEKTNPFGTSKAFSGFKEEGARGWGGRTESTFFILRGDKSKLNLHLGGEWQSENYTIDEHVMDNSRPGRLRYGYHTQYRSGMFFGNLDLQLYKRIGLTLGASGNQTVHTMHHYVYSGFSADTVATWKRNWLPRCAVNINLYKEIFAFAQFTTGNSNPGIFEQLDTALVANGRNIGSRISPERAAMREAGLKGTEDYSGIQFQLVAYRTDITGAILGRPDSSGYTRYSNAGNLRQRGLEGSIMKSFDIRERGFINEVLIQIAGTKTDYRFLEYSDTATYTGKKIPGVPDFSVNALLEVEMFSHLVSIACQSYYVGKVFLNSNNNVSSQPLNYVNARMDIRLANKWSKIPLIITIGGNNLTNTAYTSFYNLNDFRKRYFNPAPGINFYWGIGLDLSR